MQIRKVTVGQFFDPKVVLPSMVVQLAKGLGLTDEYIAKMLNGKLAKGAKGNGGRSNGSGDLPDSKLRTIVLQKLQHANDLVSAFTAPTDSFEYEFTGPEFPDEQAEPDINSAGQNTRQRASAPRAGKQQGAYVVVKRGLKCTMEQDPEKFKLWQFVWNCKTFEEFYQQAPKKAITKTGRIITAASEMAWAIKSGWVKPVAG